MSDQLELLEDLSKKILSDIMFYRRSPSIKLNSKHLCRPSECSSCLSQYLKPILNSLKNNKSITLILPAFPGKSPNLSKVLGHLPDYAEELSLQFLENLCLQIEEYYAPGIKLILCSDGRVFSDVVGIKEAHVSAYREELDHLIQKRSLKHVSTFNLENIYQGLSYTQMRDELMKNHGKTMDFLKNKIIKGSLESARADEKEAHRMYCGITRFLFEDSLHEGQSKSRSALQKEARVKAYEVIRRSNAWSDLLEKQFPEALRLSIHPQICGSKKLGIRLISDEVWMTPWHGVAIETSQGFILKKRSEAEELGAKLLTYPDGRPSHYRLN